MHRTPGVVQALEADAFGSDGARGRVAGGGGRGRQRPERTSRKWSLAVPRGKAPRDRSSAALRLRGRTAGERERLIVRAALSPPEIAETLAAAVDPCRRCSSVIGTEAARLGGNECTDDYEQPRPVGSSASTSRSSARSAGPDTALARIRRTKTRAIGWSACTAVVGNAIRPVCVEVGVIRTSASWAASSAPRGRLK